MIHKSLDDYIRRNREAPKKGPIAMVFAEDEVEVASTALHARKSCFALVMVLGGEPAVSLAPDQVGVVPILYDVQKDGAVEAAVNRVIAAAQGQWIHYCFNGEYLFHPYCETRSIEEMLAFHTEERREAMLTYVVDLYAGDLEQAPNAVDLENAMFDGSGYYALPRYRAREDQPKDRQLDIFGGIRWRFEEHIPARGRKIDRISLFRAKPGLTLRADHTLSDEEMNTFACPWHNNLTAALVSFRAAKALRHNPGSRKAIGDFNWPGSVRFNWSSQQLMDLGFMEPGQWF